MGSSQTWAWTHVPCIVRQTLNHCATREAQVPVLIDLFFVGRYRHYVYVRSVPRRKIKPGKKENAVLDGRSEKTSLTWWSLIRSLRKTWGQAVQLSGERTERTERAKALRRGCTPLWEQEGGRHDLSRWPRERTVGSEIREEWQWGLEWGDADQAGPCGSYQLCTRALLNAYINALIFNSNPMKQTPPLFEGWKTDSQRLSVTSRHYIVRGGTGIWFTVYTISKHLSVR